MTDAHVHFRDWNQSSKETILHGMSVGAASGFNVFFDMPNTAPPVTTISAVKERLQLGQLAEQNLRTQGIDVHYHLYCGLTADPTQIEQMVQAYNTYFPAVCGLKMFASQSTGNMGITNTSDQFKVYQTLTALNYTGVLAVHCEKESLFCSDQIGEKVQRPHSQVRPPDSEVSAVHDQILFAMNSGFKGTLHIAHVSTAKSLSQVRDIKSKKLLKITCGATPHHILLNSSQETPILRMNPPLRPEFDRAAVWSSLFDGTIDWVESDHAPHTLSDKLSGACGIPGPEGMLLTIRALKKACMSEARLNELFCTNALKAFGLSDHSTPVPTTITDDMLQTARSAYPFSAW